MQTQDTGFSLCLEIVKSTQAKGLLHKACKRLILPCGVGAFACSRGRAYAEGMAQPVELIRRVLPYTTVAACLALVYLAWVFYSRYATNRELQREAEQKSAAENRRIYEMYGSGQLKIMLFYANPAVATRGESAQLCYSVSNATKVAIDHGVEPIWPSLSHCAEIHPVRTTLYTLSADDGKGHHATQSLNLVVR